MNSIVDRERETIERDHRVIRDQSSFQSLYFCNGQPQGVTIFGFSVCSLYCRRLPAYDDNVLPLTISQSTLLNQPTPLKRN